MTSQNARNAAAKALRCLVAALLGAVLALPALTANTALAASGSISSKTWEEVKPRIEKCMGTPYVWAGRSTSGWDCSGFVSYVMHDIYGTGWPGGSWGMAGTDAIVAYCQGYQVASGSSGADYNNAFSKGTIKPGDIIVFWNASGATVHAAIAGENQTIYHAWYEGYGTGNCRFDYMWGIDGGHGKTYASFKVYRGLAEGGYVELTKTSADVKVTGGNASYSLEGAVFGVYSGSELVAKITTDKNGHGKTSDKVKNGSYIVREITAPKGYVVSDEEYPVTVAGSDVSTSATDAPITITLKVVKFDDGTGATAAQGDATLDGAEYQASYAYDGTAKTVKGTTQGGTITFEGIPLGAISVKETKAPAGYLPDSKEHKFTIGADDADANLAVIEYTPKDEFSETVIRGGIVVGKADASRYKHADGTYYNYPQGDASFAGAEFAVINRSAQSVWVDTNKDGKHAASEDFAPGAEIMRITTAYDAKYDAFVAKTGEKALPYGTYEVVETKTPEGYLASGKLKVTAQIRTDGQLAEFVRDSGIENDVLLGGVQVQKNDAELDRSEAIGGADHSSLGKDGYLGTSLEGIEFTITNASKHGVMVDGAYVAPGKIAATITTAWNEEKGAYTAQTPERFLPYGTYAIRETKTNESYLLTDGKARTFKIRKDGVVVTADSQGAELVWRDQVVRNDMHLQKKGQKQGEKLAYVPFLITNVTTGEAHVAVTDRNGMLNTSSGWYKHTANTNANDRLAGAEAIKTADIDESAGIWFGLVEDGSVAEANDDLGALPYGFYTIEEMHCESNAGYELWSDAFEVRRDSSATNFDVDLGTVDDAPGPRIGTTATDKEDGDHAAEAGIVTIVDEVAYANLTPDVEYTVRGTLMDKQTGEPVQHEGADVVATTTFKPIAAYGVVKLEFTFDASELAGHDIVAFESLERDGKEVAVHADIEDEGQTVKITPPPEIGTTATDASDADHEAEALAQVTINDTVAYKGLTPGKVYELFGTLMDKETGSPIQQDGQDVVASTRFTPDTADGSAVVSFTFDASALEGKSVVAFETLTHNGREVAVHADIEDEGQTVKIVPPSEEPPVPEIGTTATDADDGDHEALADAEVVIVDEVAYKNLDVGEEYTLTGTLMDKETAKPVQSGGKDVTSTVAFKPETANGTVKVTFKFDGSALAGHEVVAFETLTCKGQEVAVHADIEDKGQTVKLVEVPEEPKTPAPESPKEPEPTTPTPSKGVTPKTGDSMPWLPFACLAGVAACVSGIALLARRRERAEVFGSHARNADDTYWQDLYKED